MSLNKEISAITIDNNSVDVNYLNHTVLTNKKIFDVKRIVKEYIIKK